MTEPLHRLLLWLCTMSLLALLLFGWDKLMACRGRARVPEAALLGVCLCGGGAGGLLGMLLFRHKIRKAPFPVLVPLCFVLQALLTAWAAGLFPGLGT